MLNDSTKYITGYVIIIPELTIGTRQVIISIELIHAWVGSIEKYPLLDT